jgi:hypothetical protein
MARNLDMEKIAKGLGAQQVGAVHSSGGYFGALQVAAEVAARFRVPPRGGRATDPKWTERRLIPLSPETLRRLEELADHLHVTPLQVAALLLERTVSKIADEEAAQLAQSARPSSSASRLR